MEFFKVLGIEPTEDKELIKKAYLEKLPLHHPEEDPEGFKKLRWAFDTAMQYKKEENTKEKDAIDLWIDRVAKVYGDFEKRLDLEIWKELLEDDVCFSLDSVQQASMRLLGFITQNHRLPHEVLALLEAHFGWEEKREELLRNFHKNFVEYVIANAKFADRFRYYKFNDISKDVDYDAYIALYFQLLNHIQSGSDEADAVIEQVRETGVYHPDMWILFARRAMAKKDLDNAKKFAAAVLTLSGEDSPSLYCMAQTHLACEEYEEAEAIGEKMLASWPEDIGVHIMLGQCAQRKKDYRKALAHFEEAKKLSPYDGYILHSISQTNEMLADEFKEKAAGADNTARMEYLEMLSEARRFEEATEVAQSLEKAGEASQRFYTLAGHAFSGAEKPEIAAGYFLKALGLCGDDKEERAVLLGDLAVELSESGKNDAALTTLEEAIALNPDYLKLYYRKASVLNDLKRYEESVEICRDLLKKQEIPNAYHFQAQALFELGEYQKAIESCDGALRMIPYFDTYIIKLKCFEKLGQAQPVYELVDYLTQSGRGTTKVKLFKLRALAGTRNFEQAYEYGLEMLKEDPENPPVLYKMADICTDINKMDEGLSYLKRIKGEMREDIDYNFLLGYIYRRTEKYSEAEAVYKALIGREGVRPEALFANLAYLYLDMDDYTQAETYFKKTLEENPNHRNANGNLSYIYRQQKKIDIAMSFCEKQLEINPYDYYYIEYGLLWEMKGDIDKAIEYHLKAIESNPKHGRAYYNIGIYYTMQGKTEKALEYFTLARDNGYKFGQTYYNLGLCLARLGQKEEAIKTFDEGLQENPDYNSLHFRKGIVYQHEQQYDKAVDAFKTYYEKQGKREDSYYRLAHIYRRWGKRDKAIDFAKRAIKADKKDADTYERLGYIYHKMDNDPKKAIKYYKKAMKCENVEGSTYEYMGDCLKEIGKESEAMEHYKKSLELHLADKEAEEACGAHSLGCVYMKLGETEKAKECFEKAIEAAPRYKFCSSMHCYEAFNDLGKLYEKQGELDQALYYFERAYECDKDEEYLENIQRVKSMMQETVGSR